MTKEDYEKGMVKFKKTELIAHLWMIRQKTKALRVAHDEYKKTVTFINNRYKWADSIVLWNAVKKYLGEK